MNRIVLGLIILSSLLIVGCKNNSPKKSSKAPVIQTIDGVEITSEEFNYVYKKNNARNDNAYAEESIREYLELYTNFRLKVREAEKLGYDTTVEFKREFEDYKKQLAEPYLTEKSVSDKLVKEAYERTKQEVNASHILVSVAADASPDDTLAALNKINKYREMIVDGGADFSDIAKRFSEDPSAKNNGGNLGYFTALQMVYPFENAAYTTLVSQVSKPVRTRFGYHIVKVHDKRDARGQVRVAHIMRRATDGMDEIDVKAAESKINEIYKELKGGADWISLCKQFSEDASSAARGGELKWFGAGIMPKTFDEAAFGLQNKGDISEPVKTAYGFHIIKLLDKKDISSFDDMKGELEAKIKSDSRSKLPQEAFIKRISIENNFVENKSTKEMVFKLADSTFLTPNWSYDAQSSNYKKTLFSIAEKNYTANDFLSQINKQLRPRDAKSPLVVMNNLYKNYYEKELVEYEKQNLENKYIDYSMLLKEYRDGILLYKLMDEKVWSKAVNDTAGLSKFYKENLAKYMWSERADAFIINTSNNEILESVRDDLKFKRYKTSKYKINPIMFEGKAESLDGETQPDLDRIVGYLNGNKKLSITLNGYTDSYGSKKNNSKIALGRVEYIKNYLISKGIDNERVVVKSFGDQNPGQTNKTKEGKAKNNRVEVEFYTSSIKALEEKYNNDNSLNLTVVEGLFEKGDNAILDEVNWNVGEYVLDKEGRKILVQIKEILPQQEKKLAECKGLVISDYQNYLDQQWISSLKKKFEVVIFDDEVNKLIKQ